MKQRLLIVDDEPGIVDMMASYFSSQYEVLTASSMMQRHSYKLLSDGRLLPDILRHRLVPKFQMRL